MDIGFHHEDVGTHLLGGFGLQSMPFGDDRMAEGWPHGYSTPHGHLGQNGRNKTGICHSLCEGWFLAHQAQADLHRGALPTGWLGLNQAKSLAL